MEQYNVRQDKLVSQERVDSALVISLGRLRTKIDGQVKNNELHICKISVEVCKENAQTINALTSCGYCCRCGKLISR